MADPVGLYWDNFIPANADTPPSFIRLGAPDDASEVQLPTSPQAPWTSFTPISNSTTISPFSAGNLLYTSGTSQLISPYSYIRMGTATQYENWPSTSTTTTDTAPAYVQGAGAPFPSKGVLIYSNDTTQVFAPTIAMTANTVSQSTSDFTVWSGSSLTVAGDSNAAVSATLTGGSTMWPTSVSYTRADAMNTVLGTTTNLITGNAITQWAGNDASTGLGGLLWSNYGHTQNVFGGTIVNVINDSIDVQGIGEVKIVPKYSVDALSSIGLFVSPAVALSGLTSSIVAKAAWIVSAATALAAAGVNIAASVGAYDAGKDDWQKDSAMRGALQTTFREVKAVSALVILTQVLAIAAGFAAKAEGAAAQTAALAGILISDEGIVIQSVTTKMFISVTGIYSNTPVEETNLMGSIFSAG